VSEGDREQRKGVGDEGVKNEDRVKDPPPFKFYYLFFSFIELVQLVLLIYYFKPKYPKINGNI